MSDGRKRLSGHAYRTKKKAKEEAEEEILSKIPRISSFFEKKTEKPSLIPLEIPKSEENDVQDISSNPTATGKDIILLRMQWRFWGYGK